MVALCGSNPTGAGMLHPLLPDQQAPGAPAAQLSRSCQARLACRNLCRSSSKRATRWAAGLAGGQRQDHHDRQRQPGGGQPGGHAEHAALRAARQGHSEHGAAPHPPQWPRITPHSQQEVIRGPPADASRHNNPQDRSVGGGAIQCGRAVAAAWGRAPCGRPPPARAAAALSCCFRLTSSPQTLNPKPPSHVITAPPPLSVKLLGASEIFK